MDEDSVWSGVQGEEGSTQHHLINLTHNLTNIAVNWNDSYCYLKLITYTSCMCRNVFSVFPGVCVQMFTVSISQ